MKKALLFWRDNQFKYFLKVTNRKTAGSTEPFDFAKDKIRIILMNQSKTTFIHEFENELYNKAQKKGKIKRYKE